MAFSALVDEVLESHKRSSRYGARVARIIVHHWAGTSGGVERLVQSGDPASANYIILNSGWTIGSVPEQFRAWTSGSSAADNPSITVEVQNETGAPEWRVSAAAREALTLLVADVAHRYQWSGISRSNVLGHLEFYPTECPGPFLYPRLDGIVAAAQGLYRGAPVAVTMASPVVGEVSCEWRCYPFHAGMDIACPVGTPVYAAFAGVVREAGEMDPDLYGRSGIGARVENPDTESQYYGHLSELFVKPGDTVRLGHIIGLSGATGNVSGPHLHFECWTAGGTFWNGRDQDPRDWFKAHGVVPGSSYGQLIERDEDLNNEQAYMLTELFKRLGKFDTLNYGFGNSVLPALGRLDRDRAALLKHVTELKGQVSGLMEAVTRLAAAPGRNVDVAELTAAIEKAAKDGAREGAALVSATEVAEKLTVKVKEGGSDGTGD